MLSKNSRFISATFFIICIFRFGSVPVVDKELVLEHVELVAERVQLAQLKNTDP